MTDYLDLTTQANALPTIVAAQTLGKLASNMALLGLVNKDFSSEIASYGQTVDVNVRGSLSANTKTEGSDVTVQAPSTTKVSLTLNQHNEVTFGEEDIAIMLERPYMIPGYAEDAALTLLEEVESDIAALYSGFSQTIDASSGLGEDDFREARRQLNAAKVPLANRWAVLKEDAEYELLAIERFVNRDYAELQGAPQGLLNNYQGRFMGFNVFLDQNIKTSTTHRNMFGHPNAIMFASRPMRTTASAGASQAVMSEDGISLRVTQWYDPKALAEVMTIDLLYGVAEMRDNHCVVVATQDI